MNNKKKKIIILVLLILLFFVYFIFYDLGVQCFLTSDESIKSSKSEKFNLSILYINNVEAAYDSNANIFYYNIPQKYENSKYILKLNLEGDYKYKFVGYKFNIVNIDYDKPINVIIYNKDSYFETKIKFTNLPIVILKNDNNLEINKEDINAQFNYINNSSKVNHKSNIKIRTRGSTSSDFEKKSYRITTYDKNFNNEKDVSFSKFYYGSSFILDAQYSDKSKIREVFSTKLWNDISKDFTNVNMYQEFVEVFINNEYKGLYILKEPVNRNKLNLNKSTSNSTSIIIKSTGWNLYNQLQDFDGLNSSKYKDYEIKYPNDERLYSTVWNKFLNKSLVYYNSYQDLTDEIINNTFDINNYVDIVIFNAFIDNGDNKIRKNNFFYMTDDKSEKIYIQPWDFNYSFGNEYDKDIQNMHVRENFDNYNNTYSIQISKNTINTNKLISERYWELRKTILTKEYIDSTLDDYKNDLLKGATSRDSGRWYEYDCEEEIEKVRSWSYNRLEFLDEYMMGVANE